MKIIVTAGRLGFQVPLSRLELKMRVVELRGCTSIHCVKLDRYHSSLFSLHKGRSKECVVNYNFLKRTNKYSCTLNIISVFIFDDGS